MGGAVPQGSFGPFNGVMEHSRDAYRTSGLDIGSFSAYVGDVSGKRGS